MLKRIDCFWCGEVFDGSSHEVCPSCAGKVEVVLPAEKRPTE